MTERSLRRKLTFQAHDRTLVLVKRPVELIGFDADASRFVRETGTISITFADVERRVWPAP